MTIEHDELLLVANVVNEPGFEIFESMLKKKFKGHNSLERITGNAFADGVEKGTAFAYAEIINEIGDLRKQVDKIRRD